MKKGILLGVLAAGLCASETGATTIYFNDEANHGAEVEGYSGLSFEGFVFDKSIAGSPLPYNLFHAQYAHEGYGDPGGITSDLNAIASFAVDAPITQMTIYALVDNVNAVFTARAFNLLGELVGETSASHFNSVGDYFSTSLALQWGEKFNRPEYSRIEITSDSTYGIDAFFFREDEFSGGEYTPVPDGGHSALLLAMGVVGIIGISRAQKLRLGQRH